MAATKPQTKGSVLRGVLRDAKEQPGGIPAVLDRVSDDDREAFFGKNILHSLWYPYEALSVLLDAYALVLGGHKAMAFRELGARMAERDFTTLLKAYALISTPTRLAGAPARIWSQRFRNAGEACAEPGDRCFRFTIEGFPEMHPLLCEILTGYGLTVGRQKTASFTNTHDRCISRGDACCSWMSTW